ncbi:hypothetical protein PAHAL_9G392800 [Panicum hallii]|uniref:Uncharacterized protein n=1 Tax=Panicum hallii TaxID=206008 RepID=A0A2T8I422_9POAL|nr:hypothetical protein PAHAL_9G392800 [Panicum hallii]
MQIWNPFKQYSSNHNFSAKTGSEVCQLNKHKKRDREKRIEQFAHQIGGPMSESRPRPWKTSMHM